MLMLHWRAREVVHANVGVAFDRIVLIEARTCWLHESLGIDLAIVNVFSSLKLGTQLLNLLWVVLNLVHAYSSIVAKFNWTL